MFEFLKKKIEVTVIDADEGTVIAKSLLRPEDMPEKFDDVTTIHLENVEFDVVEAVPCERNEYKRSGKLTLRVRRAVAQMVAPQDILYTLPTICNDLGALVATVSSDSQNFEMHEDDWRQIELISKTHSKEIETELAGVEEVIRTKCVNSAFQAIFVRKLIKSPLRGVQLTRSELDSYFSCRTRYDGIAYYVTSGTIPGAVKNGFAFQADSDSVAYGIETDGRVDVVGLQIPVTAKIDKLIDSLALVLSEKELLFVDWCFPIAVATKTELKRYFESRGL